MLWGSGRHDEAIATARAVMDVQLLFCGAGALLLICLGPELISLAFGSAYRQASAPLAVLAVGLLAMALSSQNYVLQIATNARFNRNSTLFGLVLLFGVAVVLTPLYGLSGAAIARAGTMLLLALISLTVVARRWGKEAISGRNVFVVSLVIGASAITVAWENGSTVGSRVILLGIALVVLALSMQDRHGRPLVLVLPLAVLSRMRNGSASVRSEQRSDTVGPQ
jgi:O-antigen/teichoic acid export membrane protein